MNTVCNSKSRSQDQSDDSMESEEAAGEGAAAVQSAEGVGDEADLLALLKRLGLARSPSPKSSSSGGDNLRTEKPTQTPAPTNGSQTPHVYFSNGPSPSAGTAKEGVSSSDTQNQQQLSTGGFNIKRGTRGKNNNGRKRNGHERSHSDGGVYAGTRYPHRRGGGIGIRGADHMRQRHDDFPGSGGVGAPSLAPVARTSGAADVTATAAGWGGKPIAAAEEEEFDKVRGGLGMAAAAAAATATAKEDGMVDLMRREITAREALLLGPILWAAKGVTCLKLCYNHLKDGGAEAVSGAIERHPSLHTMDLGESEVWGLGGRNICEIIA